MWVSSGSAPPPPHPRSECTGCQRAFAESPPPGQASTGPHGASTTGKEAHRDHARSRPGRSGTRHSRGCWCSCPDSRIVAPSSQVTVNGFGPQQIPVLARIGTGPHCADGTVSQRNKGRRTGLHHQHKQDAGQSQQTAHGMAFHKTHRPGRQLFCGNSRFPGGLGPVFGRLFACF